MLIYWLLSFIRPPLPPFCGAWDGGIHSYISASCSVLITVLESTKLHHNNSKPRSFASAWLSTSLDEDCGHLPSHFSPARLIPFSLA